MNKEVPIQKNCFTDFEESIAAHSLPERFTFPFYYDPHPLCLVAAKELQHHIIHQAEWEHNFGIEDGIGEVPSQVVIGKMFGVLVVQNKEGKTGYLSAFSGKLAEQNHHAKFVPPVFDILREDGFFKKGNEALNQINQQVEKLEKAPGLLSCRQLLQKETADCASQVAQQKQQMKAAKQVRKIRRQKAGEELAPDLFQPLLEELKGESQGESIFLKNLTNQWKAQLAKSQQALDQYLEEITILKEERKKKSAALQQKLFEQYQFLNQIGEKKSLNDIFQETPTPAGSGECAAPKLLQYAFQHQLKPIAMAEFWWGQAPNAEIRKHAHFYPACRGKCEPILAHMLQGIEMDENLLLINIAEGKDIEIVFEDDQLLVINKPTELLSAPGKNIFDSVYSRMKQRYPTATGPLIVHRLDMSTSGLMLIAKSKEVNKFLQKQFIKRTIKKRYVALLEGIIKEEEGTIDLPLRVDINDRPRQLVCHEHGRTAQTKWKVIERSNDRTRIHFFPITGRSHQLRMHAAHSLGLNTPIVGDDLYGTKANRLHLHAESIEFLHPVSRERIKVEVDATF
ncbi:MAG: tRNA pseudouridine32 synthase/23S rRNA pseudouridine746 synthase [Saprospiraceae bacterium]|jgi:tRNA pseudouridine32 synthase/23S rRNA pseudouridine746 synthase